eukprot:2298440-Alexandrium_andersonii.AAC.1
MPASRAQASAGGAHTCTARQVCKRAKKARDMCKWAGRQERHCPLRLAEGSPPLLGSRRGSDSDLSLIHI